MDVQDATDPMLHADAIRSVAFDVTGTLFASVGDDKRVKLWNAKTWTCIKTMFVPNYISNTFLNIAAAPLFPIVTSCILNFSTCLNFVCSLPVLWFNINSIACKMLKFLIKPMHILKVEL